MDESSKMNQMVKKLLTLNQLEFGNDVVTMERFDLVSLVKGVIQSASILAQQKEATDPASMRRSRSMSGRMSSRWKRS